MESWSSIEEIETLRFYAHSTCTSDHIFMMNLNININPMHMRTKYISV